MKIANFEDIIVWQKAQDFAVDIYFHFNQNSDHGFKTQIQRASVSISNHIAEGFDRNNDREFVRILFASLAACSEVKSMLYLAGKLNYLTNEKSIDLIEKCNEVSQMIRGSIKSMSID